MADLKQITVGEDNLAALAQEGLQIAGDDGVLRPLQAGDTVYEVADGDLAGVHYATKDDARSQAELSRLVNVKKSPLEGAADPAALEKGFFRAGNYTEGDLRERAGQGPYGGVAVDTNGDGAFDNSVTIEEYRKMLIGPKAYRIVESPNQTLIEDANVVRTLTPEVIAGMGAEQIAQITPGQISQMTPAQIAQMTPEQIGQLSNEAIAKLSPEQRAGLREEQSAQTIRFGLSAPPPVDPPAAVPSAEAPVVASTESNIPPKSQFDNSKITVPDPNKPGKTLDTTLFTFDAEKKEYAFPEGLSAADKEKALGAAAYDAAKHLGDDAAATYAMDRIQAARADNDYDGALTDVNAHAKQTGDDAFLTHYAAPRDYAAWRALGDKPGENDPQEFKDAYARKYEEFLTDYNERYADVNDPSGRWDGVYHPEITKLEEYRQAALAAPSVEEGVIKAAPKKPDIFTDDTQYERALTASNELIKEKQKILDDLTGKAPADLGLTQEEYDAKIADAEQDLRDTEAQLRDGLQQNPAKIQELTANVANPFRATPMELQKSEAALKPQSDFAKGRAAVKEGIADVNTVTGAVNTGFTLGNSLHTLVQNIGGYADQKAGAERLAAKPAADATAWQNARQQKQQAREQRQTARQQAWEQRFASREQSRLQKEQMAADPTKPGTVAHQAARRKDVEQPKQQGQMSDATWTASDLAARERAEKARSRIS